MAKGVELTLYDSAGAPYASGTDIAVMWFDGDAPPDLGAIKGNSAVATTTAGGVLSLDLDNVTGLNVGDWGFLVCYKLDGTDHKDSPVFASRMQVASMTGTTTLGPLSDWQRNPDWLALPNVTGQQKFAGLFAVHPESNFVALSAEGNYTVDWGDGSAAQNVNSGVAAEKNIAYADAAPTSEVGLSEAVAVTFTDAGDLVNRTAHGFRDRETIAFSSITGTTGITQYTRYRVFNATANTFQVSAIGNATDSALALTTDGSGKVFRPQYRQVIITVTPNGGDLTDFSLRVKHSQTDLPYQPYVGWLDIVLSAENLVKLRISYDGMSGGALVRLHSLEQVSVVASGLRDASYVCAYLPALRSVPKFATSPSVGGSIAVTFTDVGDVVTATAHGLRNGDPVLFSTINSTTGIQVNTVYKVINVTADTFQLDSYGVVGLTGDGTGQAELGVVFKGLFNQCGALQSVSSFDTSHGLDFGSMFSFCTALQTIQKLDTSQGRDFYGMFSDCSALRWLPTFDLSQAVSSWSMLTGATGLTSIGLSGLVDDFQELSNHSFGPEALNEIYRGLPTVTGKTISVSGNWGASASDTSIATGKGWTVQL